MKPRLRPLAEALRSGEEVQILYGGDGTGVAGTIQVMPKLLFELPKLLLDLPKLLPWVSLQIPPVKFSTKLFLITPEPEVDFPKDTRLF